MKNQNTTDLTLKRLLTKSIKEIQKANKLKKEILKQLKRKGK